MFYKVGVGVEHRLFRLYAHFNKLAILPLEGEREPQLVGSCVGSIVTVVGVVHRIAAVGLEVRGGVEKIVLHVVVRKMCLHLAQTAVDAEGEHYVTN